MQIRLPEQVKSIIGQLNEHGYEAFAVGGCVRDSLLGKTPEDWDITTSAKPEQVKQVFKRTVDTGIQHGTVTVLINRQGYEVTTYRIDGEYEDGRHPKEVIFTPDLTEDLKRRDFTINAMAYSENTGIVDEFGGMEDLSQGVIRCVGSPLERFTEDALRILRAVRFSAQLGFEIETETKKAISEIAPNMVNVSKERIQNELTKLLLSGHPEKIRLVYETGISPYISEEFDGLSGKNSYLNAELPAQKHMRWAAFLSPLSEDNAVLVLRNLKLDNDTIGKVRTLIRWQNHPIPPDKTGIRRIMSQIPQELFDDLLIIQRNLMNSYDDMERLNQVEKLSEEIRASHDCVSLKTLAVTGNDLIQSGIKPGKQIGEILNTLLQAVLEDPRKNKKEELLHMIEKES